MKRIHLLEIADTRWCPRFARLALQGHMEFVRNVGFARFPKAFVADLADALRQTKTNRIIDLGAGGGGAYFHEKAAIEDAYGAPVEIVLTDKFPSQDAISRCDADPAGGITYERASVEATAVPKDLHGFRTVIGAFHHFRPAEARKILQDAVDGSAGIAVFEPMGRSPPEILSVLPAPIALLVFAPFVRPFNLWRILSTYLIPIAPAVILWDGIVSCLRLYSKQELEELTKSLAGRPYNWNIKTMKVGGFNTSWLIGCPAESKGVSSYKRQ